MRTTALALAAAALVGGLARADEEKIALDKLPKPILETVQKRFPKAEITGAAKETEDGKTEYEVSLKDGDTRYDVMFSAEGVLTLIEKQIPFKDLPKAVTDAIQAKYPKATYKIAEEMTKLTDGKEAIAYYEVLFETADKKFVEAEVAPDGKILKTEDKKSDKEDGDDKKDKK
ncbi:MAG TPA: PepSY-like domain-containing protein [Gemmataceae bacterium]|nr:PepSY-like domain-containing protein [Gemmataceae bacterium]